MNLNLDTPLWLAALPLAAIVVLLAGRGVHGTVPFRQRRLATVARTVAVVCVVLALAGPRLGLSGADVDVAFLLDASDSAAAARQEGLDWVLQAVAGKDPGERSALGLFGAQARLEHGLREEPLQGDPAVVVDGTATDLEQALRLGQGAVGSERRRRVVLLTDGRQNAGDVVEGARALAEAGVGLDVVSLAGGVPADLLVEQVTAPNRVRDREAYDVAVRIGNTTPGTAEGVLTLLADGREVSRQVVTLEPGTTEVTVARAAAGAGTVRYEARLEAGASTVTANDVGSAAVRVDGPPRVLVHQRTAGLADDLARALQAGGVPVDVQAADAAALPPLDGLLDYDSVVLVDVPATTLGEPGMAALSAFVRDAGRGLVAIGGEASFTLGDYDGTPLEDLLPVFASVTDPRTRPPVAEALVVDTSGSMAACHCSDAAATGTAPLDEGGVNKTDISKEAVARAVDALEAQDTIGVLAFNTRSEWVIPLQQLPDASVVDDALARLHPDGNTDVDQAVRAAIDGLLDTEARLRHIVLFTDGFTDDQGLIDVAREAGEAGITLSVVGTGEGPADLRETLRRMAEAGGGRYYPGRDLSAIPNILALEVRFAVRPVVNEGTFFPVITGTSPAIAELASSPPLRGYLATTSKPTARTLLRIGDERDPLLATWQAGLGTATAWTSDVAPRWSADWVTWDRFSAFWSGVVKDTFPAEEDARGALAASVTPDGVEVRLDTASNLPADAEAAVTITRPDGTRVEAPLDRVAIDAFEATVVPGAGQGVYAVSGRVTRGEEELYRGTVTAIRSYPAEYAISDADPALLDRALEAAGGRRDPDPVSVFDPTGLAAGEASRELWPVLAVVALLLAAADVGLRRLRLEAADWTRPHRRPSPPAPPPHADTTPPEPPAEPAPPPPPPARSAGMDALLRAKRRARGEPDDR